MFLHQKRTGSICRELINISDIALQAVFRLASVSCVSMNESERAYWNISAESGHDDSWYALTYENYHRLSLMVDSSSTELSSCLPNPWGKSQCLVVFYWCLLYPDIHSVPKTGLVNNSLLPDPSVKQIPDYQALDYHSIVFLLMRQSIPHSPACTS